MKYLIFLMHMEVITFLFSLLAKALAIMVLPVPGGP